MKTNTEKELLIWLNRDDHTLVENFNFGIKAILSVDFVLSSKYNVVLEWLSTKCNEIFTTSNEESRFYCLKKFLEVKYPISLIEHNTCSIFVDNIINFSRDYNYENNFGTRNFAELLLFISKHDIFKNITEGRYEKFCLLQNCILTHYERYMRLNDSKEFALISEKKFCDEVIQNIKEYIKRIPHNHIKDFASYFQKSTLTKLIEVMLFLKNKIMIFNDVLEIEKNLFSFYEKYVINFDPELPVHVHLINSECALLNFQGDNVFYTSFVKRSFDYSKTFSEPKMYLETLVIFLKLLEKHDVNLKFNMEPGNPLKYIAGKIQSITNFHIKNNIKEVMWLLSSTIKLNPLILEHSIFEIAAKVITSPKLSVEEQTIYEDFITTLLDMFKKLNRPEKYVANLLKALQEHLKTNKFLDNKRECIESVGSKRRKLEQGDSKCVESPKNCINEENYLYFNIILKEFGNTNENLSKTVNLEQNDNFKNIAFAWPYATVGKVFSKFISSLVSKPSLVIWKTILYHLQNLIAIVNKCYSTFDFDETFLFSLDLAASLLAQYFAGSKLIEHYDKFQSEIEGNITFTKSVLKEFGHFLLNIEHNNRIVNAFLQIVLNFGMFVLIAFYYPSQQEFKEINITKTIYDFLSTDEWILVEQRIANFGDFATKYTINILSLQKLKGKILTQNNANLKTNFKSVLSTSNFVDPDHIIKLLVNENNIWLIQYLSKSEKTLLCNIILQKGLENELIIKFLETLMKDYDCLKIVIFSCYENIANIFTTKRSVLNHINFIKYKQLPLTEKSILINQIIQSTPNKLIKNLEIDKIDSNLKILNFFNIASCEELFKMEIFLLHFCLYRDLLNTANNSLIEESYKTLEHLLYFKPRIKACNLIRFDILLKILSPLASEKFYELLFQNLRESKDEDLQTYLSNMFDLFKVETDSSNNKIEIILVLINIITKVDNRKYKTFLKVLLSEFEKFFLDNMNKFGDYKDDLEYFVNKTFKVYPTYLNYALFRTKNKEFEITENFRKICKFYIGYSVSYLNEYSVRLITIALNNREQLHFDPDEIQLILQKFWEQIQKQVRNEESDIFNTEENTDNSKHYKEIIKLIVDNNSKSDFRNFLSEMANETTENSIIYVCRIIQQLSRLQLDKIKCAILNEYFKKISLQIIFNLDKDSNQQFSNSKVVIILLKTMTLLSSNREIILSLDHIDNILSFLIDINIKKFVLTDNNENIFKQLHNEMADLCIALIKSRYEVITDRIPQFVIIYQDLLQSLCWYKSERHKDIILNKEDILSLAEIGAKMQNIIHLLAKHELSLKRIAPYLLTFIINLMVTDKRATTLYGEIKTHIESICYALIKVCDHRVGPFILRCTNDATRYVYENLVKDFKKYHKFKGKI